MVVLWSVLLAVTVIVFVVLHAVVLPRWFLNVGFSVRAPIGRGVRVIRETNGRSIVYDADVSIRKYIPQYILSERGGKKQLVCRAAYGLSYLDFDIVLFDNFNKVTGVLHVKELLSDSGYTGAVDLPDDTAYASIYLNAADGYTRKNKLTARISGKRWLLFLAVSAVIEIFTVFMARACIAHLFGGLFGEIFLYSAESNYIACGVCLLLIVLNAVFMAIAVRVRTGKNKKVKKAKGNT